MIDYSLNSNAEYSEIENGSDDGTNNSNWELQYGPAIFSGFEYGRIVIYTGVSSEQLGVLFSSRHVVSMTKHAENHPAGGKLYFGEIVTSVDFLEADLEGFFEKSYVNTFLAYDRYRAQFKSNQPELF